MWQNQYENTQQQQQKLQQGRKLAALAGTAIVKNTSHGHHDITSADYTLGITIYEYIEKR